MTRPCGGPQPASVRRVEDITEAPLGKRVSPSTVPNLNKKIYAKIETWHHRQLAPRPRHDQRGAPVAMNHQ